MSISLSILIGEHEITSGIGLKFLAGDYSPSGISVSFGVAERAPWDPIWQQFTGQHVLGTDRPIKQLTGTHEIGAQQPLKQLTGLQQLYVSKQFIAQNALRTTSRITGQHRIYVAHQLQSKTRLAAAKSLTEITRIYAAKALTAQYGIGTANPARQLTGQQRITDRIAKQITVRCQLGATRSALVKLTGRHRIIAPATTVQSTFKVVIKRHAS